MLWKYGRERAGLGGPDQAIGLYSKTRCSRLVAEEQWHSQRWSRLTWLRKYTKPRSPLVWLPEQRLWAPSLGSLGLSRGPICKKGWNPLFEELIIPFLFETRIRHRWYIHWAAATFYHYGRVTVVTFGFKVYTERLIVWEVHYRNSYEFSYENLYAMPQKNHQWGKNTFSYHLLSYEGWNGPLLTWNEFIHVRVLDVNGNHSWRSRPKYTRGNCGNEKDFYELGRIQYHTLAAAATRRENSPSGGYGGKLNVSLMDPPWRWNLSGLNLRKKRLILEYNGTWTSGDKRKRRRLELKIAEMDSIVVE